jgi:predicted Zn-dependent peptidase
MENKNKLTFKKTVLPNGFTIHSHHDPNVEIVHMSLVTPVGSVHNHGDILPGTFHFLEHLAAGRSVKYPKILSGAKEVEILGGGSNASTASAMTSYDVRISSKHLGTALDMLTSSFFEPIITDEFVDCEKGIIANERKRRELFYPSMQNERGQYIDTVWRKNTPYSVEQIFGSDADFEKMNAEYFKKIHENFYLTSASYLIIAGNFEMDYICKKLELIKLKVAFEPISKNREVLDWNQRNFHTFETRDVSRFEYFLGWLYNFKDLSVEQALHHGLMNRSIIALASSPFYGKIFDWLRNEKQWLYEIKNSTATHWGESCSYIACPVNSMNQVIEVQFEIRSRLFESINEESVENLKKQWIGERDFQYQTIGQKLNRAKNHLHEHGEIIPEEEFFRGVEDLSPEKIRKFFESHVALTFGEMVMVPPKKVALI